MGVGRIIMGIEYTTLWEPGVRKYSPDQPRAPKGTPEGGQWTDGPGTGDRFDPDKSDYAMIRPEVKETATDLDRNFEGEPLSDEEKRQTAYWTTYGDADSVNGDIRRGQPSEKTAKMMQHIDAAIAKERTTADLTVYRAMAGTTRYDTKPGNMETVDDGLPIGSIITDPGFVSTTADYDSATVFAKLARDPVIMKIRIPKGSNALHLHPGRTAHPREHEILLPRGSRFRVISRTRRSEPLDGMGRIAREVDVELIPGGAS